MQDISAFQIYLLAMLPDIKNALDFSGILTTMIGIFFLVVFLASMVMLYNYVEVTGQEKKAAILLKKYLPYKTYGAIFALFSVLTFSSNFVPNYKQAAIIIGGTWAVNNENVRQLPDEIASAVNRLMESVGTEN